MFSVLTHVGVYTLHNSLESANEKAIQSQNVFSNIDTVIKESFKNGVSRRFYIKDKIWSNVQNGNLSNDVTILSYIDPTDLERTKKALKRASKNAKDWLDFRGWY